MIELNVRTWTVTANHAEGLIYVWMDGWMDGRMNGWMDGGMDEYTADKSID
jgi:hypothetical protein